MICRCTRAVHAGQQCQKPAAGFNPLDVPPYYCDSCARVCLIRKEKEDTCNVSTVQSR